MPYSKRYEREFTPLECQRIAEIYRARMAASPYMANGPNTIDADNAPINGRLGIAGEWAVADFLGLPIARVFEICPGGDGGYDQHLRDGRRLHVKTTRHYNGILKIPPNEKVDLDGVYVLCSRRRARTIGVGGACRGDQIGELGELMNFNRGVGYQPAVRSERLHDFDKLVRWQRRVR